MPWSPPIPAGALYSPATEPLGPGVRLLAWCYDRVERDGWCAVSLTRAAEDIGKPYGTIRDWWALLRAGPFFVECQPRGKQGWAVRFAPKWLDWRVMRTNYPDRGNVSADMSALSERGDFSDQPVSAEISAVKATEVGPCALPNVTFERGDFSGDALHVGTHDDQESCLSLDNDGGRLDSHVPPPPLREGERNSTHLPEREPSPPHSARPPAPTALPPDIEAAAGEWLDKTISPAERRRLLALLGSYGADWLRDGVAAAAGQGGRSVKYLETMLTNCKTQGTRPGGPRQGTRNGTGAHTTERPAAEHPADADVERARIDAIRNAPRLIVELPDMRRVRPGGSPGGDRGGAEADRDLPRR